ncbi:hypothetical protein Pmani_001564 [Petrolisthes manimaculis]|uniref:Uncharacterized protein n=1 Tax=Petrolisthes manimaculis TaxID=1843537 RepID=A0AAE1UL94_9EUCA|nr:hypothetical protein Pmani_001564 [Petrolisthes manimaculis]
MANRGALPHAPLGMRGKQRGVQCRKGATCNIVHWERMWREDGGSGEFARASGGEVTEWMAGVGERMVVERYFCVRVMCWCGNEDGSIGGELVVCGWFKKWA